MILAATMLMWSTRLIKINEYKRHQWGWDSAGSTFAARARYARQYLETNGVAQ